MIPLDRLLLAGLVAGLCLAATRADDKPAADAARFAELKAQYEADLKAATKPYKDPETGKVIGSSVTPPPAERYVPQLMELGQSDDEATAVAALTLAAHGWLGGQIESGPAFDLLLRRFGAGPRVADYLRADRNRRYAGQAERLARVVGVAKDPTALAMALHSYAGKFDPKRVKIEGETPAAQDIRRDKALALYRRVAAEFPAVENGALAKSAARSILALTQLRAGLPAPSLDAKDSDGKPLKLADFKGKVVVADFWGSWCGPCIKKLPMLKEVAAKYADQDVVFVGVMNEAKASDATKALEKYKLPWRNVIDLDAAGGDSPICKAWGVSSFPSVYVIDAQGKFAATNVMERAELEAAIEAALAAKK